MASSAFRWILQLHRDVPKAAKFHSEGLDFSINVCSLHWAELQCSPLKLTLLHSPRYQLLQKEYSSLLSFTVADISNTITKLMALGAELDGPIKYEIHGKPCGVLMDTCWVFTRLPESTKPQVSRTIKVLLSGIVQTSAGIWVKWKDNEKKTMKSKISSFWGCI